VLLLILVMLPFGTITTADMYPPYRPSAGSILYVGGNQPGNYSKIQDAINNASDGDTVFVYDDSSPYRETLWINASIALLGENRTSTVISGYEDKAIITINAGNVTVQGFTIQGAETNFSDSGVFTYAPHITVLENIFKYAYMGIYAISNHSSFTKNEFTSLYRGMWLLYSHDSRITENTFGCNEAEDLTAGGADCVINNNTFTGKYGLKVWKNNHTMVSNNTFSNSCLIDLYESYGNTICHNTLEHGGFTVLRSNHNSVFDNTRDGVPIVYLDGEKDATIEHAAQVILVQCRNITVRGIPFADLPCGIYLEGTKNSAITRNTFSNCAVGISLAYNSWRNVISQCRFDDCPRGITMYGYSVLNRILNNTITNADEAAIIIDDSFNTVSSNTITNATLGICLTNINPWQGPTFAKYRKGNIVSFNTVQNAQYGIVVDARFTSVKGNRVTDCWLGIGITKLAPFALDPWNDVQGNVIQKNDIEHNHLGLLLNLTIFNIVEKNNFIANDQQASFIGLGFYGQLLGTQWRRNYWGGITLPPEAIRGVLYIPKRYGYEIYYEKINWVEFDWLPAQRPYQILI